MTGDIDRDDILEAEIPLKIRNDKGGDETSAGGINVDRHIEVLLNQQVIDSLDVLVLARVRGTQDGADTDGILVNKVDRLLGVNDVAVGRAVDELLLDLEVAGGLLPADLDGGGHDNVGVLSGLALGLTLVLPALLHGEDGEHDGLGGADARGADGADAFARANVGVEELANHGDAAVLDVC